MEAKALANLVTAAAVNKRLLMRILAHLEQKDLSELHEEVAALDAEFRTAVTAELEGATPDLEAAQAMPEAPLAEGEIPVGREEERRGHALPNTEEVPDGSEGTELGRDHITRITKAPPADPQQ